MIYYLTSRPATPGAIPSGAINVINYDNKKYIEAIRRTAWAAVEYSEPLPASVAASYEMIAENEAPDRKQLEHAAGLVLMKSEGIKGKTALARVEALTIPELLKIINK